MATSEPDDLSDAARKHLAEIWRRENQTIMGPTGWHAQPKRVRGKICTFCGDDADGIWKETPMCADCQAEVLFGVIPGPEKITAGKAGHVPSGVSIRRIGRFPGAFTGENGSGTFGQPDPSDL